MDPNSDLEYSDEYFPIEPIWALKSTMVSLIWIPFSAGFLTYLSWIYFQVGIQAFSQIKGNDIKGLIYPAIFMIFVPLHFFINVLRRATFHYSLEDKFLSLGQGLIKKQTRQLPYGVIQNIVISRGILDRIFGLSTLVVQNASAPTSIQTYRRVQQGNLAGFTGNTVSIPGLSQQNAEKIKDILQEKIKQSPINELGM